MIVFENSNKQQLVDALLGYVSIYIFYFFSAEKKADSGYLIAIFFSELVLPRFDVRSLRNR